MAVAEVLRGITENDRVRRCRVRPLGGLVVIKLRPGQEGRASWCGLETCGSVWLCPMCAAKISAGRVEELCAAIDAHAENGGRLAMVTLTMRHRLSQGLGELWAAKSEAWAAARGGNRLVRRLMVEVEGWACVVEVTVGDHGWHVHIHSLMFLGGEADESDVALLGGAMFDAWATRLVALGLDAPIATSGGLDAKLLDTTTARSEIASYLAKGTFEAAQQRGRELQHRGGGEGGDARAAGRSRDTTESPPSRARSRSTSAAALELAGPGKRGRRQNRTPMQVLGDIGNLGLVDDVVLWREWEAASKGKRQIGWSRGLRDRLGVKPVKTDDELARDDDELGIPVATWTSREWRAIRAHRFAQANLLELAEGVGIDDALWLLSRYCEQRGLPPPRAPDWSG